MDGSEENGLETARRTRDLGVDNRLLLRAARAGSGTLSGRRHYRRESLQSLASLQPCCSRSPEYGSDAQRAVARSTWPLTAVRGQPVLGRFRKRLRDHGKQPNVAAAQRGPRRPHEQARLPRQRPPPRKPPLATRPAPPEVPA